MRKLILLLSLALAWLGIAKAGGAPQTIAADAIAQRIAQTFAERLPTAGRYRVALSDPAFQLVLPAEANGRFEIAALNYDPAHKSFVATLAYAREGSLPEYVGLTGTALAVIEVPAVARDVAAGETIAAADLVTIELPAERAGLSLIASPAGLAGQTARRPLRARTPLFAYDVKKPALVRKGDIVTLVYALPGIELSAQGQALAEGAKGDTVAVLNTRSRKTIEARVIAAGTLSVAAPTTLAASQ